MRNDRKIPCVFHENKFVSDFREKAKLFNTFLHSNVHYQRIIVTYQKSCHFLLKNV